MKKILILSANPKDTSKLRLDEEVREIQASLKLAKSRDNFEVITEWAVRIDDFRRVLLDNEPQIVHFSGHSSGEDGVALENATGQMQLVSTESLARLFELFKGKIECVLLNACYSEVQAEAIHQHVDCVIGMNHKIADKAAIKFVVGFYDALGTNRSYEEAYKFGCNAIDLEGIPESSIPVLKSRNNQRDKHCLIHWLENPEGSVPLESPFYIKIPAIESECTNEILKSGALIRVKAPQQWGKTSLMVRILDYARQQSYQTTSINFFAAENELFANLDKFLQWFCLSITEELDIENKLFDYWKASKPQKTNCTNYFQQYILKEINKPVVLALDNLDLIFKYSEIASEFFGLLRFWHENSRTKPIWEKLRLVISHSYRVDISYLDQSPFNVGLAIELPDFTQEQVKDLVQRHGLNWTFEEVETLIAMVGGHPYLLRLGLYRIARRELTLKELLEKAPTDEGVYGKHLRNNLHKLTQNYELLTPMRNVVKANHPVMIDSDIAARLVSMGLVKFRGNHVLPMCDMYRLYFRERLGSN